MDDKELVGGDFFKFLSSEVGEVDGKDISKKDVRRKLYQEKQKEIANINRINADRTRR